MEEELSLLLFLQAPMMHCSQKSSTLALACLRLSRYRAIVNPMDIQTSSAVFWTCLKAVSIWLLSVLLAVPEAVFSQVVSMQVRSICGHAPSPSRCLPAV